MLNLKQIFLLLVGLNGLLLIMFFNVSYKSSSNQEFQTPKGNDGVLNIPNERSSFFNRDESKTDPPITPSLNDASQDDSITVTKMSDGKSNPITKDELDSLNQKIQSDPRLTELVTTFKKLKIYYKQLSEKYRSLEKSNMQLKLNNKKLKDSDLPGKDNSPAQKKFDDLTARNKQSGLVLRYSNPFYLLGAYPNITLEYFNSYPDGRPFYENFNYGLSNDNDYCELTDLYNLAHLENVFKRKTFFTDYDRSGLPRQDVMRKIGYDLSPKISKFMPRKVFNSRSLHLDPRITMFFTKRVDLHIYHEIGKNFLCATQMYNHIPGHGVLKRKDMIVDSVDSYALLYKDKPQCFNKGKFFPFSYRLYIKEECQAFFNEINSAEYKKKLETEPIQYLIKIGYGSHRAMGVFLLDTNQTAYVQRQYNEGELCGENNRSLIAQTYVTNPLLLDFHNKFDFRVYMLVASTNPLIMYYHDGFLRVSLHPYDKFSNDRSTHLTNTHLSKDIFAEVKKLNKTLNNMNEQQLRDYQMWTLERLKDHLLESGKIKDPNWLDNYLRPKFKEAFIHILRMTGHAFWNQSNVFEMFGLDFMLDEDLNLWFIECNSSPQLVGTNAYKTNFLIKMLKDIYEIQYAFYKSRMLRVVKLIKQMELEGLVEGTINYTKWRPEYIEASRNRLEPQFELSSDNSFHLIMDLNKDKSEAYFGNLKDECII